MGIWDDDYGSNATNGKMTEAANARNENKNSDGLVSNKPVTDIVSELIDSLPIRRVERETASSDLKGTIEDNLKKAKEATSKKLTNKDIDESEPGKTILQLLEEKFDKDDVETLYTRSSEEDKKILNDKISKYPDAEKLQAALAKSESLQQQIKESQDNLTPLYNKPIVEFLAEQIEKFEGIKILSDKEPNNVWTKTMQDYKDACDKGPGNLKNKTSLSDFKQKDEEKLKEDKEQLEQIASDQRIKELARQAEEEAERNKVTSYINAKDTDNKNAKKISFKWLLDAGDTGKKSIKDTKVNYSLKESGKKVATKLRDLINEQGRGYVYVYFEDTPIPGAKLGNSNDISDANQLIKFLYKKGKEANTQGIAKYFEEKPHEAYVSGYSRAFSDNSKTFAGELYIKGIQDANEVYINLAKLITSEDKDQIPEVTFSKETKANNPKNFDMKGYDVDSRTYADAFFSTMDELDDRKEIQKKIHGIDWDDMLTWNVTLGDMTFFVPPTNIRLHTIIQNERMPVIRSKGSMARTDQRTIRGLELDIYFNEDRGINGYTYTDTMPDGKTKISYSMNGFRALESMFRFTPYVPITNKYINKTLGVDAVVLTNISVTSVQDYPKLLKCTILMKEFNWQVYMPDIMQMQKYASSSSKSIETQKHNEEVIAYWNRTEEEKKADKDKKKEEREQKKLEEIRQLIETKDYKFKLDADEEEEQELIETEYRNWFATSINWRLFRYYYQTPIIRGDLISTANWDPNSDAYISATCGAKTSYIPMKFENPNISFYIANEKYLKRLLELKFNIGLSDLDAVDFNDKQLEVMKNLSEIGKILNEYSSSQKVVSAIKDINQILVDSIDPDAFKQEERRTNDQINSDPESMVDYLKYQTRQDGFSFNHCNTTDGTIIERDRKYKDLRDAENQADVEYELTFKDSAREKLDIILNDIETTLKKKLDKNYFDMDSIKVVRSLNAKTGKLVFGVEFALQDSGKTTLNRLSLKNNLSKLYNAKIEPDNKYDPSENIFFYDNKMMIPLVCRVDKKDGEENFFNVTDNSALEFGNNNNSLMIKMLNNMNDLVDYYTKKNEGKVSSNASQDEQISLLNMKYDDYLEGGIRVHSWQAQTSNRMAPLRTLSNDCFAPQYLGGEDIAISIVIFTTDENKAKMLNALPKKVSKLARNYHIVMPYVPLRISSEFSKLLGVNEVTIEDVSLDTVPDNPGLYRITMEFLSTDRITREKEKPVKGSLDNFMNKYTEDINDETLQEYWADKLKAGAAVATVATIATGGLGTGAALTGLAVGTAGKIAIDKIAESINDLGDYVESRDGKVAKPTDSGISTNISDSYFLIKNQLSKIDLYPDLELPKIEDLEKIGYYFMRYKFEDGRTYVDPDFYFVYPVGLTSQIYRELAIHGMSREGIDSLGETKLTEDDSDALTVIKPMQSMGYIVDNEKSNEKFKENLEKIRKENQAKEAMAKETRRSLNENLQERTDKIVDLVSKLDIMMEKEKWDISTNICCMFLERRFLKELQSYEARKKSNSIGNGDDNAGSSNRENAEEAVTKVVEEKEEEEKNAAEIEKLDEEETSKESKNSGLKTKELSDKIAKQANGNSKNILYQSKEAEEEIFTKSTGTLVNETLNKQRKKAEEDRAIANGEKMPDYMSKTTTNSTSESENKDTTKVYTEGEYTNERYSISLKAVDAYIKHLQENSPYDEDPSMSQFAEAIKNDHDYSKINIYTTFNLAKKFYRDKADAEITHAVDIFFQLTPVKKLMKGIFLVYQNDKFIDMCKNILYAAACAATAPKEYTSSSKNDWRPNYHILGEISELGQSSNKRIIKIKKNTDYTDKQREKKVKEGLQTIRDIGTSFGIFNIPLIPKRQLISLLSPIFKEDEIIPSELVADRKKDNPGIHVDNLLMDPYYRLSGTKIRDIKNYKESCAASYYFCAFAFLRIIMYWLCILVKLRVYPGLIPDSLRGIADNLKEVSKAQHALVKGSGSDLLNGKIDIKRYINFYSSVSPQLDSGKIFLGSLLALISGNNNILTLVKRRDYNNLNALIKAVCVPAKDMDPKYNKEMTYLRKLLFALVGQGAIDGFNKIGINQTSPGTAYSMQQVERMYLEAAEDPSKYIPHSFHDMIVNDARGRMLRAFPTFYMIFIDEGRQIGYWKLHDNFYHINSIASIEVVKSRKIPADTCRIVMSNFYNSYSTEMTDEHNLTLQSSFEDMYNSIFGMQTYAVEQEIKRTAQDNTAGVSSLTSNPDSAIGFSENYNASLSENQRKLNLRLRTGARIHVRMGYGNNANMLPILFNGVIAEMSSESAVEIIAQGDGIELMNPIFKEGYVEDQIVKSDNFFWNFADGATPLEITTAMFTNYGGVMAKTIKKGLKLNLCDRNPFGIVHFGDPDFRMFMDVGEPAQNLYESCNRPINGINTNVKSDLYNLGFIGIKDEQAIEFTFDVFQKTPWDILNICKSTMTSFITGVTTFGFRSTAFMGMPHYYYCYDYYRGIDKVLKERRKPYQQWHIYTSESDIIDNKIVASSRDMKTVALGLYTVGAAGSCEQKTVGPIFADWDIYKEQQKTMIVDTNLLARGVPLVGRIPLLGWIANMAWQKVKDWNCDDKGVLMSDKKLAWRQTASALKESIMDMYDGSLVLIGDPSVKPHDRFYMSDSYTGMYGQALVKDVTTTLSIENGFTTVITPDCITTVNDNNEIIKYMTMERIGCMGTTNDELVQHNWVDTLVDDWNLRSKVGSAVTAGSTFLATSWLTRGAAEAAKKGIDKLGIKALSAFSNIAWPIRVLTTIYSLVVSPMINETLFNELKNNKAITIFPLKKYGHVYTAGFDGARGSVYGSPTWGDRGTFGEIFDWIDEKFPIFNNIAGTGFSVADLFLDRDVIEMADRFRKASTQINKQGSSTAVQNDYGRLMAKFAGDEYEYVQNNFRSAQMIPRVSYENSAQVLNAYNEYALKDTSTFRVDPKFKEVKLISQDPRIIPYINEQFFSITHDNPTLCNDYNEEIFDINGIEYRTKSIESVDEEGNRVLDLPMLNEDAINILYEILRRTKNNMPNANSSDLNETWEATKNDFIVLKSALRVGDRVTLAANGFVFIIQATNSNSQKALKEAIESLDSELKSPAAKELGLQTDLFYYKQNEEKEIVINVTMPSTRVTDATALMQKEIEAVRKQKELESEEEEKEEE